MHVPLRPLACSDLEWRLPGEEHEEHLADAEDLLARLDPKDLARARAATKRWEAAVRSKCPAGTFEKYSRSALQAASAEPMAEP